MSWILIWATLHQDLKSSGVQRTIIRRCLWDDVEYWTKAGQRNCTYFRLLDNTCLRSDCLSWASKSLRLKMIRHPKTPIVWALRTWILNQPNKQTSVNEKISHWYSRILHIEYCWVLHGHPPPRRQRASTSLSTQSRSSTPQRVKKDALFFTENTESTLFDEKLISKLYFKQAKIKHISNSISVFFLFDCSSSSSFSHTDDG